MFVPLCLSLSYSVSRSCFCQVVFALNLFILSNLLFFIGEVLILFHILIATYNIWYQSFVLYSVVGRHLLFYNTLGLNFLKTQNWFKSLSRLKISVELKSYDHQPTRSHPVKREDACRLQFIELDHSWSRPTGCTSPSNCSHSKWGISIDLTVRRASSS